MITATANFEITLSVVNYFPNFTFYWTCCRGGGSCLGVVRPNIQRLSVRAKRGNFCFLISQETALRELRSPNKKGWDARQPLSRS